LDSVCANGWYRSAGGEEGNGESTR
jgi:hypothetical protein